MAAESANRYELSGDETQVTYETAGIGGRPHLSYAGPKGELGFSAEEVDVAATALGTEVTVTLESIPDLHVLTLTLLVPDVRIERGGEQPLRTAAILTANFSAVGSPPAIGQSYEVVELAGVARLVEP